MSFGTRAIGTNGASLLALATKQKAFLAIVGMLAVMAFFPTNFYTAFNLLDMLNSTSILLILAFGVTLTVISGGCDLSIGGILVVAGIIAIKLLDVMPIWAAILCAVAFGAFVGFINGFLVVYIFGWFTLRAYNLLLPFML